MGAAFIQGGNVSMRKAKNTAEEFWEDGMCWEGDWHVEMWRNTDVGLPLHVDGLVDAGPPPAFLYIVGACLDAALARAHSVKGHLDVAALSTLNLPLAAPRDERALRGDAGHLTVGAAFIQGGNVSMRKARMAAEEFWDDGMCWEGDWHAEM
eukprot:CAMPEP_0171265698 /NCGR_PEP_ID=MMETSP0790-20130122/58261_1 /TAXON_ID=2925 /ORGANISM="Alexandrium catenella, Strain OF101" /LENGTH=151 /DNA_ID=CAMNT_0011734379 /DNA_START=71 /DNA_END=528 /DNA_ORIENTATION=+